MSVLSIKCRTVASGCVKMSTEEQRKKLPALCAGNLRRAGSRFAARPWGQIRHTSPKQLLLKFGRRQPSALHNFEI
jgi:hypothetical protein